MKTQQTIVLAILATFSVALANVSFSADSAASSSTSTSTASALLKRTNLYFYSILEGASVTDPLSSVQGSDLGNDDTTEKSARAKVDFYNILSLRYNNSPKAYFQGDFRFNAIPINGMELKTKNPRLGFSLKNVTKVAGVTLSLLRLRFELPVTEGSRKVGQNIDPNLISNWGYDFGGSEYSLGFYTETRYYNYSIKREGRTNGYNFLMPSASYQINSKLSASLAFAHSMSNKTGQAEFLKTDAAYFNPSVSYEFADSWSVAPYMYLYTHNKVGLDASAYGFELSGTLF